MAGRLKIYTGTEWVYVDGPKEITSSWAYNTVNSIFSSTASYILNSEQYNSASLQTGSFYPITSSWSESSSYSETSSYVINSPTIKSGIISGSMFGMGDLGTLTASVQFNNSFVNKLYSISIIGNDARVWTVISKSESGFIINSGDTAVINGEVMWQTIYIGEYY